MLRTRFVNFESFSGSAVEWVEPASSFTVGAERTGVGRRRGGAAAGGEDVDVEPTTPVNVEVAAGVRSAA